MKKIKALIALSALVAMVALASVAQAQETVTVTTTVTGAASIDALSTCVVTPTLSPSLSIPDVGTKVMDTQSCTFIVDASGEDYDLQIDEVGASGVGEGAVVSEPGMCSVESGSDVTPADTCAVSTIADISDGDAVSIAANFIDAGEFGLYMPGTGASGGTYDCESSVATDPCALDDGTLVADEESFGQDETWTLNFAVGGGNTIAAGTYSEALTVTLSQD